MVCVIRIAFEKIWLTKISRKHVVKGNRIFLPTCYCLYHLVEDLQSTLFYVILTLTNIFIVFDLPICNKSLNRAWISSSSNSNILYDSQKRVKLFNPILAVKMFLLYVLSMYMFFNKDVYENRSARSILCFPWNKYKQRHIGNQFDQIFDTEDKNYIHPQIVRIISNQSYIHSSTSYI